MTVTNQIEESLITPSQFAVIKKVGRNTVWNNIYSNKIEVVKVGMNGDIYIDYSKYKDYQFDLNKRPGKQKE